MIRSDSLWLHARVGRSRIEEVLGLDGALQANRTSRALSAVCNQQRTFGPPFGRPPNRQGVAFYELRDDTWQLFALQSGEARLLSRIALTTTMVVNFAISSVDPRPDGIVVHG